MGDAIADAQMDLYYRMVAALDTDKCAEAVETILAAFDTVGDDITDTHALGAMCDSAKQMGAAAYSDHAMGMLDHMSACEDCRQIPEAGVELITYLLTSMAYWRSRGAEHEKASGDKWHAAEQV